MFSSQEKITRHAKKRQYDPYTGQATETACESKQMVEFSEKDFKVAVINLSRKRNEAMTKEAKKGMMIMSHQTENINEEIGLY